MYWVVDSQGDGPQAALVKGALALCSVSCGSGFAECASVASHVECLIVVAILLHGHVLVALLVRITRPLLASVSCIADVRHRLVA